MIKISKKMLDDGWGFAVWCSSSRNKWDRILDFEKMRNLKPEFIAQIQAEQMAAYQKDLQKEYERKIL